MFSMQALIHILCDSFCGLLRSSTIDVNSRRLKIVRLLGEGGFSYVYLVQDIKTGKEYALKKITCPFGEESVRTALKEVKAYTLFSHPTIIRAVDYAIVQNENGIKVVYILLPYYPQGNLQDLINQHSVKQQQIPENEVLSYVKDICEALICLHNHHQSSNAQEVFEGDRDQSKMPLMNTYDDHESGPDTVHGVAVHLPYAHYDLKPGNVMIDDEKRLVLMDFGSCRPTREHVLSRADGLRIQDTAAEQSTMPYRAPELFDCRTGSTIDEKTDIWSLGCLLFALLYGHSPFETVHTDSGSIALAVLNCQYQMPAMPEQIYSESVRELIRACLVLDVRMRPTAMELLVRVKKLLDVVD